MTVASLCKPWLADQLRLYVPNVGCPTEKHGFDVRQADRTRANYRLAEFLGVPLAMRLMLADMIVRMRRFRLGSVLIQTLNGEPLEAKHETMDFPVSCPASNS